MNEKIKRTWSVQLRLMQEEYDYTCLYYKMYNRFREEILSVKADDEGVLTHGEVTPFGEGRCHEVTEGVRPD